MISALKRPPFIGIFAFLLTFILSALGHTLMVEIMRVGGNQYWIAFGQGLIGAILVYIGVRYNDNEMAATWLGFFGGGWLWSGWVEFSYVFYSRHLGVQPLMGDDGRVFTLPEYLMLPSSIGVLLGTLVFFFFNRETRCNAFRWMHKHLHMPVGEPTLGYKRNISTIVAMERFYITWFFYVMLLVAYDRRIMGSDHPGMVVLFFLLAVWSAFLLNRLRKFTRLTSAFRYGIPTALVTWNCVEIAIKWRLFTEIWIKPREYIPQMTAIGAAFVVVVAIFALFPSTESPDERERADALPAE